MRLVDVQARLKDECPQLKSVLLALSAATQKSYPSVYLFPVAESARPNEQWPNHEQLVVARFAVEIMVKQAAEAASGGPAQEDLEDLRDAIKAALKNWPPETTYTPIDFVAGRLVDFSAGLTTWRDEYSTTFLERMP